MQLYTKILIGMLVGVVLGFLVGPNSDLLPQHGVILGPKAQVVSQRGGGQPVPQAAGIERARLEREEDGWLYVRWTLRSRDVVRLEAQGLQASRGATHRGWVQRSPVQARTYSPLGQTLVDWTEWLGRLFLAMIKMVVVPLVFFSLILGIASLGDFRKLGRMGGMTIGFFTATTTLALTIGLCLTNLVAPGALMGETDRAMLLGSFDASGVTSAAARAPSLVDQIVGIVPANPFAALANAEMLQVIFFATMIGIAFTLMDKKKAALAVDMCDAMNDAMVLLVHIAMKLAPVGVAALLFKVVGTTGLSVLIALAAYGGVVLLGLLCHISFVYLPVVQFGARVGFFQFLRAIRAALVLAFSTSSSSATLPVTMRAVEDNLAVSNEVASFVLPIGATVNMDGTALYQGVAALFIAQIYGIDLTLVDQATIVVSATMASIGAAGVPGAGMLTLAMVLAAVGVPVQGIALVIGVDRVLDMFRTATNVIGDATATVLVARMQGEPLRVVSPAQDAADPEHGVEGVLTHPDPHPVHAEDDEENDRDARNAQ
ncbi:MAG: dicarboxylate/amino acid:cation symporter [Myxococcales bacterium]|nr:dicarboxylate/amino acid:cation symporter [Myxococcales bacterium]MDD9969398.1 dicarboxylate/amino acid:cation symporter [Myxococcales bacterium]